MTETITRLRATFAADGHGNDVPLWASPAELKIDGCVIWPRQVAEQGGNRDFTPTAWTVGTDGIPDVTALDRLRIRGDVYEVDGTPQTYVHPTSGNTTTTIDAVRRDG